MKIIEAKSTTLSLLTHGKILGLLRPWIIKADADKKQITIKRRNWYFINYDEEVYAFKSIRNVKIDRHIFGADLSIRVYAGEAKVYYIDKGKAAQIRDLLMDNDWSQKDEDVYIELGGHH